MGRGERARGGAGASPIDLLKPFIVLVVRLSAGRAASPPAEASLGLPVLARTVLVTQPLFLLQVTARAHGDGLHALRDLLY